MLVARQPEVSLITSRGFFDKTITQTFEVLYVKFFVIYKWFVGGRLGLVSTKSCNIFWLHFIHSSIQRSRLHNLKTLISYEAMQISKATITLLCVKVFN